MSEYDQVSNQAAHRFGTSISLVVLKQEWEHNTYKFSQQHHVKWSIWMGTEV